MLDYLLNLEKKGGIIISKKKKDDNEHECKHEVGKSTINVNVNCSGKEHEKPSAFKAVNSTSLQDVTADMAVFPVSYPDVVFDLNNEYNPATSIFTAKQDGVYSIIGSVNFGPFSDEEFNNFNPAVYRGLILIFVNNAPVAADNDFASEIPIGNVISVSTIHQLSAGDQVRILFTNSIDGIIFRNPLGTRFEAARLPSPKWNEPPLNAMVSNTVINDSPFKVC